MIIKNSHGVEICKEVKVADSIISRMLGLMFTKDLGVNEGLIISPCNSIHTFFMNYNLDIIFLDKKYSVVKVIYNMKPWRISWMYFKAYHVLEMKAGTLKVNLEPGETLEVLCIN
jgi:uncharacterized membrane protein (UPF0127 family)